MEYRDGYGRWPRFALHGLFYGFYEDWRVEYTGWLWVAWDTQCYESACRAK